MAIRARVEDPPLFSIIIPSYQRPGPLSACLASLGQLKFRQTDFEVIVADDGSPAPLEQTVAYDGSAGEVRWVRHSVNEGPASARNRAAEIARGQCLVFIDDDTLAEPDWLKQIQQTLCLSPGCAVGGKVVNGQPKKLCAAADQAILDAVYAYYNPDPSRARFFASMNLAVPADAFHQLGGFDTSYRVSEDREFCSRWLASGRGLVYAGDAVLIHDGHRNLAAFWRRHYEFGKGAYRFRSVEAHKAAGRVRLEPSNFYRSLLTAPFRSGVSLRTVAVCGLVGLSQAASALGFFSQSWRDHNSTGRSS